MSYELFGLFVTEFRVTDCVAMAAQAGSFGWKTPPTKEHHGFHLA